MTVALSVRLLFLAGVLGLSFALVWPSVRVFTAQARELDDLQHQRDDAQAEVDELNANLARWDDPAYVVAQARERLAFVFPGETPYRVVDPEIASPFAQGSADAELAGVKQDESEWFERLWGSIETAGGVDPATDLPATAPDAGADEEATEPSFSVDFGA